MPDPSDHPLRVLVLCPMRIEHRAVLRAVTRSELKGVTVVQTGVGKDAIVRVLRRELDGQVNGRGGSSTRVILAGACGALRQVEDVPPIARIIDLHGGLWECRNGATSAAASAVTLVAVDEIVSSPADKAALAARTGAAVVDMESHAFAAECQARGLSWHVVRGVSDTPRETLPIEVLGWITPEGNTRAGRAAIGLARRPRLVPHIASVVRRSNRVLPLVGRAVVETIERWSALSRAGCTRGEV